MAVLKPGDSFLTGQRNSALSRRLMCNGQQKLATSSKDASSCGGQVRMPPCPSATATPAVPVATESVSVARAFTNATVLVTGATGYLGSLVVEQLLRAVPGIKKVYVIVRSKWGMSGKQRMDRQLQRSMWHLHRHNGTIVSEVRAKLSVLEGDLLQKGCGLSAPEQRRLGREVDYVIHCAASISFSEHIHTLLAHNYQATRNLANLSRTFGKLRAFVHLSTAYANCEQPRGSHVEERLYPMDWGRGRDGRGHTADTLAAELQSLPAGAASQLMGEHLRRVGMPNAYVFTKRMAEALVTSYGSDAFPVCIVRPSLIGSTARAPHPGYFGNNAGPTAVALAFAVGIATFTSHQADSVFDVIPGDVCSSIVIAACAATSQRRHGCHAPLVFHACTSTTNPATLFRWWDIGFRYWSAKPAPLRLTWGSYPRMDQPQPPVGMSDKSWVFCVRTGLAQAKFWVLSALLHIFGHTLFAAKLWSGWQAWKTYNRSALDFNLFFCSRASQQLEAALPTDETAYLQLVWRAGQDDWTSYLQSHFDNIRFVHFRQSEYRPLLKG